ncbi:MAG: YncE family protein [Bacteroidia bacterium]
MTIDCYKIEQFYKLVNKAAFILLIAALGTACVKDKPVPAETAPVNINGSNKVFIINEGNFGSGNAGVSIYDPNNGNVVEDIYKSKNGNNIGDVAQSMTKINGDYYIVVNNSGKVVICDKDFKQKGSISGFTSPRYLLQVSNQKAYVSDLYANAVNVVNLNDNTIIRQIPISSWTEKMVMLYNKVYVAAPERAFVYIIDASSDLLIDSINVSENCYEIALDKNDNLIALSGSGQNDGKLSKYNAINHQFIESINISPNASPRSLTLNKLKDTLYFIGENICMISLSDFSNKNENFISKGNKIFYSIALNPNDGRLYVSDALDYVQKSNIHIFDKNGVEKGSFKAGINAGNFYFE